MAKDADYVFDVNPREILLAASERAAAAHVHAARTAGHPGRAGLTCGRGDLEEILGIVDLLGIEESVELANARRRTVNAIRLALSRTRARLRACVRSRLALPEAQR